MDIKATECCENCIYLSQDGICYKYMTCKPWREWFGKEWTEIRKVAHDTIEAREERKEKQKG